MADYKRLITYAYNYESGNKKQNVGHARVEVFGNELRVKVNIKVPSFSGKFLKLYFYKRVRGGLKVAYLCDLPVADGFVDEKVQAVTNNVGDSGLSFNELEGFVLYYNPTKCIVSDWKDNVLTSEELNSVDTAKSKQRNDENSDKLINFPLGDEKQVVEEMKDIHRVIQNEVKTEVQDETRNETRSVNQNDKSQNETQTVIYNEAQSETQAQTEETSVGNNGVEENRDLELDNEKESKSSSGPSEMELFRSIASKIVQNIDKTKVSNDNLSNQSSLDQSASNQSSSDQSLLNQSSWNRDLTNEVNGENVLNEDDILNENNILAEDALSEQDDDLLEDNINIPEQVNERELEQEIYNASEEFSQDFPIQGDSNAQEQSMDNATYDRLGMGYEEGVAAANTRVPTQDQGIFAAANQQVRPTPDMKFPWRDSPNARKILNGFPRVYPFEDGEIAECVKIEPKDIGLLPMDHWGTGNNSFLLHGYNNYHHLLFAKKQTRNGCLYLLMVPGVYNAREKYMARLFGFEYFKCAKRRTLREGEFGYWYLTINF